MIDSTCLGKALGCDVPSSYMQLDDGKYYFLQNSGKTFQEAEILCANDGAWLAMFKTKEEYELIKDFAGEEQKEDQQSLSKGPINYLREFRDKKLAAFVFGIMHIIFRKLVIRDEFILTPSEFTW